MKGLFLRLFGIVALAVGTLPTANAQLLPADTSRYRLMIAVNGRYNFGNFERNLTSGELGLYHLSRSHQFGFALNQRYTYGTFGKAVTESDLLSRNFIYLNPKARIYPYGMLWLQTSKLAMLAFRYQAGVGITWSALPARIQNHWLKFSVMASYESNKFERAGITQIEDPTNESYNLIRGTLRVQGQHKITATGIELNYEGYLQPAIQNFNNQRLFADVSLMLPLWKMLSLKFQYLAEYNTAHVGLLKPTDGLLSTGLVFRTR